MDLYQKLTVLNSIMSVLTLGCVLFAVLPHVKQGAVIVRDALLWLILLATIGLIAWRGVQRLAEKGDQRWTAATSTPAAQPAVSHPSPWRLFIAQDDPYYAGNGEGR